MNNLANCLFFYEEQDSGREREKRQENKLVKPETDKSNINILVSK